MKRFILLCLCISMFSLTYGQVGIYRSSGYGAIKKEKPQRTYHWENMILGNYDFGFNGPRHAVGLTYARCKLAGFYVNAMVGTEWHFATVSGSTLYRFCTNNTSHPQLSFTAGGIIKMVIPLYLYLGGGYAYQGLTYQTIDGEWANYDGFEYYWWGDDINVNNHGGEWEVGLIGNIKGFTISAGYAMSLVKNWDVIMAHHIKIGLGYTFPDKQKRKEQQ